MLTRTLLLPTVLWMVVAATASGQPDPATTAASLDARISALEGRVARAESLGKSAPAVGGAALVAAAVCALWAQNTRRNAWVWFFFGLVLGPIAVLAMLYWNSEDRRTMSPTP